MGPLTGFRIVEFAGIGPGPMAAYYERQFVSAGGLMSYGARRSDAWSFPEKTRH
jgi:hypothetical protein